MPAPTTIDALLGLVRKSNLLTNERLDTFLAQAAGTVPTEPSALADRLVQAGLVTNFQAEQFLLGKWRGFTLGKYRVLERLGFGGTGTVYLCEHQVVRRRVAVKVLPVSKADNPAALGRFYREARAAGVLDHPNLVKAHDIDEENGLHFLVMEYVDGTSLQEIIARFGPLSIERAAHYTRQAALGLQAAHEGGLIHRDIKPANILLDRQGVVRVLDLGLARFFCDEDDPLTLKYDEKNVLGTADYVAPEQALNSHEVDIRADIYSLGATCYFLLAGQPPFPGGKAAQKLIWHQVRTPTPVRQLRHEVPAELSAVVDRMLAKDPRQRYQTPAEVVEALAPWTAAPIPPPASGEMPRLSPAARGLTPDPDSTGPKTPTPRPGPWSCAVPTTPVPPLPGPRRQTGTPAPAPAHRQGLPAATPRPEPERKPRVAPPIHPSRRAAAEPRPVPPAAPTPTRRSNRKGLWLFLLLSVSALLGLGARVAFERLRRADVSPSAANVQHKAPD